MNTEACFTFCNTAAGSASGRTMRALLLVTGRKIGIVGLGTGTIAAYARESDEIRFYEINPAVRPLAERYFTYLSDCRAPVSFVLGDARLALAAEPPQGFHVLVLDAFSSDAIPVHLITSQALGIYRRHMNWGAVIQDLRLVDHAAPLVLVFHWLCDRGNIRSKPRLTASTL
jgi:spermidine synthase